MTAEDLQLGTRLGIDSYVDTSCVNNHAYIETIVDGITVDTIPFYENLGKPSNLPIVYSIYTYDNIETSETLLLRINNTIYAEDMSNALLYPIKPRDVG